MFEEEAMLCHDKTEKKVDNFLDTFEEETKKLGNELKEVTDEKKKNEKKEKKEWKKNYFMGVDINLYIKIF